MRFDRRTIGLWTRGQLRMFIEKMADITGVNLTGGTGIEIASETNTTSGAYSATINCDLEGTEVKSTGETGTAKFLRVDGDGTSSWNIPYTVGDGGLTQNNFTNDDHTKLNNIETAATADQTDAEIKAAVENAEDSNVFTDNDHTKLNNIETAATADQSASEIKTLLEDGIDSVHYVNGSIDEEHIANDAVTADKLADAINEAIAANSAKVTNATHTGDVTGGTALTIADDAVDLDMLSATGTASESTFLRGDNSWAAATDLSTLADGEDDLVGGTDQIIYLDNGTAKRKQVDECNLGQFNNDQGWTANTGDMTGVDITAGTGISVSQSGTTSGNYTATITCDVEGTEVKSTGESGGSKVLTEAGDGTCAWVEPVAGDSVWTGGISGAGTMAATGAGGDILKFGDDGDETINLENETTELRYLDEGSSWNRTDARDANEGGTQLLGITLGTNPAVNGMLLRGFIEIPNEMIKGDAEVGAAVYASESPGYFDFLGPTAEDNYQRVIGHCVDRGEVETDVYDILLFFDPDGFNNIPDPAP